MRERLTTWWVAHRPRFATGTLSGDTMDEAEEMKGRWFDIDCFGFALSFNVAAKRRTTARTEEDSVCD